MNTQLLTLELILHILPHLFYHISFHPFLLAPMWILLFSWFLRACDSSDSLPGLWEREGRLWMPSEGAVLPAIAEQKSCWANTPLCKGKPEKPEAKETLSGLGVGVRGGGGCLGVSGEVADPIEQVHQQASMRLLPAPCCPHAGFGGFFLLEFPSELNVFQESWFHCFLGGRHYNEWLDR